jgi:hypothetical protein
LIDRHAGVALSSEVRDRLVAETGGNPLALLELSPALSDAQLSGAEAVFAPIPVSARVERAFLARVDRLSEETQTLLLVAAADDTGELATVRREVAARAAVTATIDEERRAMDELARQIGGEVSRTAAAATAEAEEAFLALGEDGHVRGLDESLPMQAAKVEAALAQLEDRRRREELHKRAIDAWDRPAMKRGAIVLGAAATLILAMLVFAIVR